MKRTPIKPHMADIPALFHPLFQNAAVYDSSCSPEARVIFIDKNKGYFLKSAPKESLQTEAVLTEYFHRKGLTAPVLEYVSGDRDWLLTQRVAGEDGTYAVYLDDPKRLCDTTATLLRQLHDTDHTDCPIPHRTADYLATAQRNYEAGMYDCSLFLDEWAYSSAEEAWQVVEENRHLLKTDTLLHGDYCLPNVMLDNWRFSGFIDLGNGGVGDRHIDVFWGAWTLFFNLKTDRYCGRFLDAYGRESIDIDMLRVIAAIEVFG